jgi:hypothetical protein
VGVEIASVHGGEVTVVCPERHQANTLTETAGRAAFFGRFLDGTPALRLQLHAG